MSYALLWKENINVDILLFEGNDSIICGNFIVWYRGFEYNKTMESKQIDCKNLLVMGLGHFEGLFGD